MGKEMELINEPEGNESRLEELKSNVQLVEDVLKTVMKKNVDYGKIPGCGDKYTLLKPGAEKLCMLFRLAPELKVEKINLENGHREYEILCRMYHIPTGRFVGEGVGCCSTLEVRYRFRNENTGKSVPKEYWDTRDPELLGGKEFKAKKINDKWVIVRRVENEDLADEYNTAKKIAAKRAKSDAVLKCTGASMIFTQDLEDKVHHEQEETKEQSTNGNGVDPNKTYISTGRPVPKEFWDNKDPQLLGGKEFRYAKIDDQWMITREESSGQN